MRKSGVRMSGVRISPLPTEVAAEEASMSDEVKAGGESTADEAVAKVGRGEMRTPLLRTPPPKLCTPLAEVAHSVPYSTFMFCT